MVEKKSLREAYGKTLCELGAENNKIVVLDADLSSSTQTKIFAKQFPNRFFNSGIAEQDMIATAAGLASQGKIPFVSTFAMFATGRTYDQIRNSICYPKFNVKIVATHGGVTVGEDGASHQALEDVALMRNLPNMTVIVPADYNECQQVIRYASEHNEPMYIRIPRTNLPDIFSPLYKFDLEPKVITDGFQVSVITNGETLTEVLEARNILEKEGISVQVIHCPVVKPANKNVIKLIANSRCRHIFTVENHSIIGGLGSMVSELLTDSACPLRLVRIGVNDKFGQSGTANELLDYYGLSACKIAERIKYEIGDGYDYRAVNLEIPKPENKELFKFEHLPAILNDEKDACNHMNRFFMETNPVKYSGTFFQTEENKLAVMIGHEFCPFLYRGENQNFPKFQTSWQRLLGANDELKLCLGWIKKHEFIKAFKNSPYYSRGKKIKVCGCEFDFDLEAVAQHYEFATNYLDLTKDLGTALFFAYCKCIGYGQYEPICFENEENKDYKPYLYVANMTKLTEQYPDSLKIVGFQALLRPFKQSAMALDFGKNEITKSEIFDIIELPRKTSISCGIYEHFKEGYNLFPEDVMSNVAKDLKSDIKISKASLDEYCNTFEKNVVDITKLLTDNGFEIVDEEWRIFPEIENSIHKEFTRDIIPFLENFAAYRGTSESA